MKKSNLITLLLTTITTFFLMASISFAQDPSADDWVTNGVVTSITTEKIGIGTTDPDNFVHLEQDNQDAAVLRIENPNTAGVYKYGAIFMAGTRAYNVDGWPNSLVIEGTGDGGLVLGAYDSDSSIKFQTNHRNEKMRISSSGNVGIGTTNPGQKLEIVASGGENVKIGGYTHIGDLYSSEGTVIGNNIRASTGTVNQIEVSNSSVDAAHAFYTVYNQGWSFVSLPQGHGNAVGTAINVDNNTKVRITTAGNVGIGTTNPGAKLDVQGQVIGAFGAMTTGGTLDWNHITNARSGNGHTLLLGTATNGPGRGTYFHPFNFEYGSKNGTGNMTQLAIPYYNNYGNAGDSLWIRTRYSGVWTSWRQILTENAIGNVGIGTTSPQSKLAVNGTITTKEVKVTETGWSDFVFEDSYSLPSLDKVETFIKENKHLPDIPSAKEVEEEGLSMAEMMAKQMQKIEELTLYVIEQNKEIQELKEELAELKK